MKYSPLPRPLKQKLFLCGVIAILLVLPSCSLQKYRQQAEIIENVGSIKGTVDITSSQKGTVFALIYREENDVPLLVAERLVSHKGEFLFTVIPGNYYIATYIDTNNDGKYQTNEHGNFYGAPDLITVSAKEEVTIAPITVSGNVPATDKKAVNNVLAAWKNNGIVVTLADPRFNRDYYTMGLWEPLDFLEQAEGGLFFLQDFQKDKTPILFIHGANGGPTDWKYLITGLDKNKFQPWVIYYPTGLRLDMISNYLVDSITRLQHRYDFPEIIVIGHSMGGLVARSFVKKYIDQAPENRKRVKMAMTINAPMEGLPSAASGVKNSPIVIPSWRDLATDSAFVKDINAWDWPKGIPFHLVISYKTGNSGDGIVPLQSQSSRKLQTESTRIYLFNNDHAGILSDYTFTKSFNSVLSDLATPDRSTE